MDDQRTQQHYPQPVDRFRVPFAPLSRSVRAAGGFHALFARMAIPDGEDAVVIRWRVERAWNRGLHRGALTPRAADLLTVRLLGITPHIVWPDWEQLDTYPSVGRPRHRRRRPARIAA